MAGPKGANQARADEDEWDALNRGEAYYTQWIKNKFAARQTAQDVSRKKRAQKYREDLLNDWKGDQWAKYQRTMAKLKLMVDPGFKMSLGNLKGLLWAMNIQAPPNAPPGVFIAEFQDAKTALMAEKRCNKFKPMPIRVQWITKRPQTEFAPPSSYYDVKMFHCLTFTRNFSRATKGGRKSSQSSIQIWSQNPTSGSALGRNHRSLMM